MAKAAERIDAFRPDVASTVFDGEVPEEEEVVDELEYEDEQEYEDEESTEEDYE